MRNQLKHFIGGKWVASIGKGVFEAFNPSTEELSGHIVMGNENDVDVAVRAARDAFKTYSKTSREERLALLERIGQGFEARTADLEAAVTEEMGAPEWLARDAHAVMPKLQIEITIKALKAFEFDVIKGNSLLRHEPIGVCGLITPWNWPALLVMTKVLPALAVGCTVVLKPSEFSSFSAQIIAEIMQSSGVPEGVFNLVYGDGPTVGASICSHPDVDMVSFTGSTRAGIQVALNAAPTIKRVHQELGGKSPNIILPSADLSVSVPAGVQGVMANSGQTCAAPTRMLVPENKLDEVKALAKEAAEALTVGLPSSDSFIGPVVNKSQFDRIQNYIQKGIDEGATVIAGGLGRPDGLERGYFVKPTVFADTTPDMTIVKEEIFGPVLVIQGYEDVKDGINKANDTNYGLAAYFQGKDIEELREVASQVPAGQVYLNGSGLDLLDWEMPFGGFKRSGNGREWAEYGFEAFLEQKAFVGYVPISDQ